MSSLILPFDSSGVAVKAATFNLLLAYLAIIN